MQTSEALYGSLQAKIDRLTRERDDLQQAAHSAAGRANVAEMENERLKIELTNYAEALDNVREVLGLEATHYLVIHYDVRDAIEAARREAKGKS